MFANPNLNLMQALQNQIQTYSIESYNAVLSQLGFMLGDYQKFTQEMENTWEHRLPRAVYIKACWPPTGKEKGEFLVIHLDNLHLLFDTSQ